MSATSVERVKRVKDTEEVIAGVRRQVRSMEARVAAEDPWALADVIALKEELAAVEIRTVARLRAAGYTWNDIGFNLGLNAIQAHKRYAHKIAALDTL